MSAAPDMVRVDIIRVEHPSLAEPELWVVPTGTEAGAYLRDVIVPSLRTRVDVNQLATFTLLEPNAFDAGGVLPS